ncbi:MAG: maf [Chlamydiia bacterium]|nr:maf [Chlamydiia bacterium]
MELILGSSSPRRKEILEFFSYPFRQASPPFDESLVPFTGNPAAYVTTLALEKAYSLKERYSQAVIVTADTIVFSEGEVLGKPKNEEDMRRMLMQLSGRWHSVFTGVAVVTPEIKLFDHAETRVLCNPLSSDEIQKYMKGHSLYDKAGAYAIQASGSLLVNRIEGCYYNVMGLPVNTVHKLLVQVGIELWDYLKKF